MRKEEQWIVEVTTHAIGRENMAALKKFGPKLTPGVVMDKFKGRIYAAVKPMTAHKLGEVCVMGCGNGTNHRFDEFIQVSSFGDLHWGLSPSMMGDQLLQEIAARVIACIACDIARQEEFRHKEQRADHSYALK